MYYTRFHQPPGQFHNSLRTAAAWSPEIRRDPAPPGVQEFLEAMQDHQGDEEWKGGDAADPNAKKVD